MSRSPSRSSFRTALAALALLGAAALAFGDSADLEIVASDGQSEDHFGVAVAMEGDTLVVGALAHYHFGALTGSAYVFLRDGEGDWIEQQELLPADAQGVEWFGRAVALDGDTVVVGAPASDVGAVNCGSAYVFTRDAGGTWSQQARLVASDPSAEDYFGYAVACYGDTVVVGAPYVDGPSGTATGAAHVFARSGAVWTEQVKLEGPSPNPTDSFGRAVALDADTLLIGGRNYAATHPGRVHVFTLSAGDWVLDASIGAFDGRSDQEFGFAVAMDAERFLVGEPGDGAVYVLDPAPAGGWSQTRLLPSSSSDGFGMAVAMGSGMIAVGAPWEPQVAEPLAGAVHLFGADGGGWAPLTRIVATAPEYYDHFGFAVALDGDVVACGVPYDGTWSHGSVQLFHVGGPKITTESLPHWTEGTPYDQVLMSSGGTLPVRWSLSGGTLPVAGGIDPVTGSVQGVALSRGVYDFALRVTDPTRALNERRFQVRLNPWPEMTAPTIPLAVLDRPFSAIYSVTKGTPGHLWTTDGEPPPGLTVDPATGLLAGRPTEVGVTDFKVRCTDSCDAMVEEPVTLEVVPVLDMAKKKHKENVAVGPADRPPCRALELVEGTRIDVTVKLPEKDAPVALVILDGRQRELDIAEWTRTKRKSVVLKRFVAPKSDRYFVVLRPDAHVTGSAMLKIKVTPPAKAKGEEFLAVHGKPEFTFGALPGARVTIVAKAAAGSDVSPTISRVLSAGEDLLVQDELRLGKRSAVLKMKTPVPGGTITVVLGARSGTYGSANWTVKVKEPRKYLYLLPDTPAYGDR